MAKGGSSGENYQPQASWMERKSRIRKPTAKAPTTTTWRRRTPRHTPRKKLLSMSSDNVESSPREALMVSKEEEPLMVMASSTGYSTDTFERDEELFIKDLEKPKTPRKVMNTKPVAHENASAGAKSAPFAFQKRLARIDWRTVHTIDVDRVIREVDIDTLETVLDTIAFGDIQGEDTRNFTEANFVKIFRLAQLMVEYLLHVQELLADHKAELLQAGASMQQKSEKIRSRFLWQRNSLSQTRHELKQAKKTLKTYEVMLKMQGKSHSSQINKPQVRLCPFCEKVFESSYYLDLHVARRHQKTQELAEDKILAVVSKAEEATAARFLMKVKAEMSLAVQTEIQQLRDRYQEDLLRAETTSNTQVRSLQADLKQSNNQLHDVQTRLEILQAQILSASPSISQNARLGNLYAVEKPKEKDNGPDQERLYDLESKFTGLEHQVKTLGQENSRLLKELNLAYAEVSDVQAAKRQKVFALENQVDDLRKENQHLKRTMSKVNNMAVTAGVTDDISDEPTFEAHDQYPDNSTVDTLLFNCTSRRHSPPPPEIPQPESVEVPMESIEIQEDDTNNNHPVHTCHNIPEHILAIMESTEFETHDSDFLDLQKLENTFDSVLVQPPSIINACTVDESLPPLHESEPTGESDVTKPFKKLQFFENVTESNMVEEEPIALSLFKERRDPSSRQRWIREPDKDQALLALARPMAGRRRTEAVSAHNNEEPSEQETSPEPEHYRHSTSPAKRSPRTVPQEVKYETSPERMRKSAAQRPKSAAVTKGKPRGDESPTTVEEMRARLEKEMTAVHKEQKRRQKAVQRLLAKELEKEKIQEKKLRGKRTKCEDARSCKPATQYPQTSKSESPCESIAPLLLALRKKEAAPSPSSIHTVRNIVSNRVEFNQAQVIQPKLSPLRCPRTQSFHSPPPHKPGPGCKRSLPAVHPYVRPGLGNPVNPPSQPWMSLHAAVYNSNPEIKTTRNQIPKNIKPLTKEDITQHQVAVHRELVKYFPSEKQNFKKSKSSSVKNAQPTKPEKETTESEANETETIETEASDINSPFINVLFEEDEVEKRTTSNEDEKVHRIQEIAEVAAMDVGEETPSIPIPEKQKWLTEHPFVPIPTLPHVVAKYPHPETAFEKAHKEIANEFDGQLREELKKFGIASNTNGISDSTYNSISSALEKQRSLRMSQIHGSERKVMEYERGAIVWHTQRAVHDRDIEIIESQFDIASNSGSDHLSDDNASDDSRDESGKSNYNSSRSHQSHKSDESDCESREDCREDQVKPLGASHMKSSEQSSPQSSEIGGSSDDLQEIEVVHKNEHVISRVTHPVSSKADGREYSGPRSPPDGRAQYVSRAFSWNQKQAQTTRGNRDFSSRELVRPDAEVIKNGLQSEQGEDQVEEELGLGDWDSDEDAVPSRGKQRRVKIADRQLASVLEDSPPRDLSPPKEFLDMHHLKSSMASTSYKPTPPPSSPKSSTATVSAENTCRANPQKPIVERSAPLEIKDETLGKSEDPIQKDEAGNLTENDESDGSDGSDVEESKIFKELTSEIDEIISL